MASIDIGAGEQFAPEFLEISPNNKIPAIVDPGGPDGKPISLFESGAILLYLAAKTGRFLPADLRGRHATLQWLMWQMGGLGPMAGQNGHFLLYAPEKIPYALERYSKEVNRLYGVLDAQLARTGHYVAGDEYTIADMAIFPWIRTHKAQQIALAEFPHVERWYNILFERPAAKRGLELGKELRLPKMDDEARKALFGQTARSVRTGAHKFG
jgi:GST-like protein